MLGDAGNWKITLVYGGAHFGKSLFWYSSELLFAYFLTEYAGLPAAQMGLVLASGFLLSAGIDVAVGLLCQRWLRNAQTAGRMQVMGAVLSSLALAGLFMIGWFAPEERFLGAIGLGIAFRVAYAIYDIPQNALMSLATIDRDTRLRVASTRIWFSGAATLIVAAAVGPMVAQTGSQSGPWFLVGLSLTFSAVAIVAAVALSAELSNRADEQRAEPSMAPASWNPSLGFWLLLAVSLITTVFTPVFSKLEAYFAAFTLQSPWWGGMIIIAMALGVVGGQPLWVQLVRATSSAQTLAIAAVLQIAGLLVFWSFGASLPQVSALAAFVFGLGNGGAGTVQWHAFSDIVAKEAHARAGLAYGLFVGVGKVGLAGSAALIAGALAVTDYREPANVMLVTIMTLLPAVGAVLLCLVAAALPADTGQAKPMFKL
jgi:glycoside/pentoside/hexuronide:cation symporter, GPH family